MNIAAITPLVCAEFGVTPAQILAHDRHRPIAGVRQVAMFLARELTGRSLPEIGRAFKRDHTTVLHAVVQTQQRIGCDPALVERMDRVRVAVLRGGPAHV